jgi:MoxR-like ATPase
MKKLVSESISEFRKKKSLNEGIFSKALGAVKSFFQKVGKFFFFMSGDEPESGAIAPINIGIMNKGRMINPAISYLPNEEDLDLDPTLGSLTPEKIIAKRGPNTNESLNEARVALEHPDKNVPNIDKNSLYRRIRLIISNPNAKALMIWGAPGIGKTQIVKAVLKANTGGRLIDIQTSKMAPDDWALPAIYKLESGEMLAKDIPKSWLPVYIPTGNPEEDKKRNEIANMGIGGVIFLDELSRASGSVQNTCLKLVDERVIGDAKLGDKWAIVSASNRAGDDADSVQNFSTALGNRFTQVNYIPDFKSWKEWAIDKIDPRILDFLEFNQEHFYNLDDDPEKSIFASPRSWEAASNNLALLMQDAKDQGYRLTSKDVVEIVGSDVGLDIATELGAFLRLLESFKKEDIEKVLKQPDKAPLPKKAGSGYDQSEANALISLVITSTRGRELDPQEFSNFAKYLVRLDNPSLATRGIKMMFDVHKYMHEELGEVGEPGEKDKYKEGVDIFIEKYKDIF